MLTPENEVVDLLDLDTVEPGSLTLVLGSSFAEPAQILVATATPWRQSRTMPLSARSAPSYIGDVSTTRQPPSRAASTTSRANAASSSKVAQVPSPTTGPSRRSSIS